MGFFVLRIKALLWKEVLQALRDPRLRFLIILPPLLQLVAFGYAANLDLKNIPIALYDEDRSNISREIAFAFASSGYFKIVRSVERQSDIIELIDRGTIKAALHFGPDLASRIKSRRTALAQVIVAGTNSNTASLVQSYSLQIFERFNRERLKEIMNENPRIKALLPSGAEGIIRPEIRIWYNTDLLSRNFYVPGIISLVIMVSVLNLTAMAVVREKEMGTMEQIMVTPIRPLEFILGKTLPFAAIGIFQVALVGSAGVFWFGIPMRGSVILLFSCLLIYLLSILSLGLFISTISRNQQQALVTTFFFTFPIILLSGFIFPISNMPYPVQVVTYANPLRYFLVIIRDIFLKGSGLEILWPQMAALLGVGLALMALAVKRVRKTME